MTKSPSIEEFAALQQALEAARSQRDAVQSERDAIQCERDSLAGENRILRVQRDLLQEKLNKMMRKVFAASSEVMGTHQKDMFFYRDFLRSQVTAPIDFLLVTTLLALT